MQLLVISDPHWPGENRLLWRLAREIIRQLQPENIYLLGDCMDPSAVSHWEKNPQIRQLLQDQFDIGATRLAEVRRDAPNSKIVLYRGNHEAWFEKFLLEHAPELRNLRALQLPALLRLDEFNITYKEEPHYFQDIALLHGHELKRKTSGVYAARTFYHRFFYGNKAIMGHWHIMQSFHHTIRSGKEIQDCGLWINGTLADIPKMTYIFQPEWQHSVTLCHFNRAGKSVVEQIQMFVEGARAYCYLFGKPLEVTDKNSKTEKDKVIL